MKTLTKKQKKHTELIELANVVYGNTMAFAMYVISNSYDKVTLKTIESQLKYLKK